MPSLDPKSTSLLLGPVPVTGLGEEDIEVAFTDEEDVKQNVGFQGDHSYTENADQSGTITFTVKASSTVTLAALEALRATKQSFSVLMKDQSDGGPITVTGPDGRIMNRRNPKRGKEEQNEEFVIAIGNMVIADI